MEKSNSMNIYNLIILDESGSMSAIYDETLQAVNEAFSGIRKNQEEFPEQRHYVSIVTFEGIGMSGVRTRRDRVPVGKIWDFTEKDYQPGGCTPLLDAMGRSLHDLESKVGENDRVFATVITDGYENSSQEYTGKTIKALVSRLRTKGWTFAYIGANQDAIEAASELNIDNALNFESSPSGMSEMSDRYRRASRRFACLCSEAAAPGSASFSELFEEDEEEQRNN